MNKTEDRHSNRDNKDREKYFREITMKESKNKISP